WPGSEPAEHLLKEISEAARVLMPAAVIVIVIREIVVASRTAVATVVVPTGSHGNVFRRYHLFVVLLDLVPAALKGQRDPLLMAIDIAEGLDLAVVTDPSRKIRDVNGDRFRQRDFIFFGAVLDEIVDLALRPAVVLLEEDFRELDRVTHAHATVAEHPNAFVEQALVRCVVQIDRVTVREQEFDDAERIAATRWLINMEISDVGAIPVDVPRIDPASIALHYKSLPPERIAAGPEAWEKFFDLDGIRHVPTGLRNDGAHRT